MSKIKFLDVPGKKINAQELKEALLERGCYIYTGLEEILERLEPADKAYGFTPIHTKDVRDSDKKNLHDLFECVISPEMPTYYGDPEAVLLLVHHYLSEEGVDRPVDETWICHVRNEKAPDGYSVVLIYWQARNARYTCTMIVWTVGVSSAPLLHAAFRKGTFLFSCRQRFSLVAA